MKLNKWRKTLKVKHNLLFFSNKEKTKKLNKNVLLQNPNKKILLSFECYFKNKCELSKMNDKQIRQVVKKFCEITKCSIQNTNTSKIFIPIKIGDKNFDWLFNHDKIECKPKLIYEVKTTGTNRIFGFFKNNNYFILAILKDHL